MSLECNDQQILESQIGGLTFFQSHVDFHRITVDQHLLVE